MKSLFKRFEVWMLLVFVLAGVGYVLFTQNAGDEEDLDTAGGDPVVATQPSNGTSSNQGQKPEQPAVEPEPLEKSTAFAIETVDLQPSGEHWLLELQVRYNNQSDADLELTSPNAQLLTDSGEEAPTFFLAFAPPPVAPANQEELVSLRYWLDAAQRDSDLELKILDERIAVALEKPDDGSVVRDRDEQGHANGA